MIVKLINTYIPKCKNPWNLDLKCRWFYDVVENHVIGQTYCTVIYLCAWRFVFHNILKLQYGKGWSLRSKIHSIDALFSSEPSNPDYVCPSLICWGSTNPDYVCPSLICWGSTNPDYVCPSLICWGSMVEAVLPFNFWRVMLTSAVHWTSSLTVEIILFFINQP